VTLILNAMSSAGSTSLLDPGWWLGSLGAVGIFAVLFAETGLFVGFLLPGDSLLFTAGALCAATPARLSAPWVLLAAFAGTVCGAQAGYLIGRRAGLALHRSARIPHLSQAISRGGRMLSRFGVGKTLVLARFIPVVRSVINPLAGTADVPVREFTIWQVTGAAIWTLSMTAAGYLAARLIPGVTRYVMPALAVVTVASVALAIVQAVRARRAGHGLAGTVPLDELDEMPSPSLTSGSSGSPRTGAS
jgi:membrane-associated protein